MVLQVLVEHLELMDLQVFLGLLVQAVLLDQAEVQELVD
jgi:hypothetical protein